MNEKEFKKILLIYLNYLIFDFFILFIKTRAW